MDNQKRQLALDYYKDKKYKEALELYKKLYSESKECFDRQDIRNFTWSIYYVELKGRKKEDIEKNEKAYLRVVNNIIILTSDPNDFARVRAVFHCLDYLNSKKLFPAEEILKWTDKLDVSNLQTDCFSFKDKDGKTKEIASDKEKYYALRTKALELTKQYDGCIRVSREALSCLEEFHYDNDIWFKRRIALCKGSLGKKDEAIEELRQILSRKKDWFIQYDIAELCFAVKKLDDALKFSMAAALNSGPVEFKVELFFLVGKILLAQQKIEEGKRHIALAYKIRIEKEWKVAQELQANVDELNIDVNNLSSSGQIHRELKEFWLSMQKSNLPEMRGEIKRIHPNNVCGWISAENHEEYYFRLKDFKGSKSDIKVGLIVDFSIERSYDKKKERDSECAVNIQISNS